MLGWLAAVFGWMRREDRCLFRYWDGKKWRAIDVLVAHRAIWNDQECQLLSDASIARNPTKTDGQPLYPMVMVHAAEDRLRDLTRRVFGLTAWSEENAGLTLDETDAVLTRFLERCDEVKKKHKTSPTRSARTESMEPPDSSDIPAFPPCSDAESPCSPTASTAAAPTGP